MTEDEENETNNETSSAYPNLIHELTQEDRSKGGQTMTEKRRLALAINATKSGRYSKKLDFKFCNGCSYQRSCAFYEKDSACKIERSSIRTMIEMTGDQSGLSYLRELMKNLQQMQILVGALPASERLPALNQLLLRMIELGKFRFGEKHFQNTQVSGQKIVVVGYGGVHGLDQAVSCKKCGAVGGLRDIVEFAPEEPEPAAELIDEFEAAADPQAASEPFNPAPDNEMVSGGVVAEEPKPMEKPAEPENTNSSRGWWKQQSASRLGEPKRLGSIL